MQMQREGKNMVDVRVELMVKSIRWKIEKSVLERLGHVVRMDDEDGRSRKVEKEAGKNKTDGELLEKTDE